MGEVQKLFQMEPKEFWRKLKTIVEQVVIEDNNTARILNAVDKNGQRPLLKGRMSARSSKFQSPPYMNG